MGIVWITMYLVLYVILVLWLNRPYTGTLRKGDYFYLLFYPVLFFYIAGVLLLEGLQRLMGQD